MQVSNAGSPVQEWRLSAQARTSLAILAAAFLILLNAVLHFNVYGNRNYRQDEIYIVHPARIFDFSQLVRSLAGDIHPPGWQLMATAWIKAFGISEEITRWLSKLTNLFTFALLYQLGKHIGGIRVGLFAVAFLGLYGFASSLMYEMRPYPMLIMLTCALHLLFYRWLHKPSGILMIAYSIVGIAVIYSHFFSVFVFPAHAICLLMFRRYERKLWLDSLLMWSFIGASFIGWLLPFIQAITIVLPGAESTMPSPPAGMASCVITRTQDFSLNCFISF